MNAALSAVDDLSVRIAVPILNDFDAFLTFDDVLCSLQKQYLDAKDNRVRAAQEYGQDGMSDMAAMIEDSAWCAMQTRYMELRADRALMARAMAMVEDDRKLRAEEKKRDERDKYNAMLDYLLTIERVKKDKDRADEALAMYALFILLNQQRRDVLFRAAAMPSHAFNRLAA